MGPVLCPCCARAVPVLCPCCACAVPVLCLCCACAVPVLCCAVLCCACAVSTRVPRREIATGRARLPPRPDRIVGQVAVEVQGVDVLGRAPGCEVLQRGRCRSVLGSWGNTARDAAGNKQRWKWRHTPIQDPSTDLVCGAADLHGDVLRVRGWVELCEGRFREGGR